MALIACFGMVLHRALQNTPTFPLQTISADPVQQRGHGRRGWGGLNKAVIVRLYLWLAWYYSQQELEQAVHGLMTPISLRSNETQQDSANKFETFEVRVIRNQRIYVGDLFTVCCFLYSACI